HIAFPAVRARTEVTGIGRRGALVCRLRVVEKSPGGARSTVSFRFRPGNLGVDSGNALSLFLHLEVQSLAKGLRLFVEHIGPTDTVPFSRLRKTLKHVC